MYFEKGVSEKVGEALGFLISYLVFTTILYLIFLWFDKLNSIGYIHIMLLTLLITAVGIMIQRLLK